MIAATQLLLDLKIRDEATFGNFRGGDQIIRSIKDLMAGEDRSHWYHFFWGIHGSGRTHLLQASCHWGREAELRCVYIPLKYHQQLSVELLEGLDRMDVVCVDDIESIAGLAEWEERLFHLFNQSSGRSGCLLVAGSRPPAELEIKLPDLKSRLGSGSVFRLANLNDDQKLDILITRARNLGLDLKAEVGSYIMTRANRDLEQLLQILDKLDQASLHLKRELTVRFVKETLDI